jgi:hypothetical protein
VITVGLNRLQSVRAQNRLGFHYDGGIGLIHFNPNESHELSLDPPIPRSDDSSLHFLETLLSK